MGVVSYRNSTSNHNFAAGDPTAIALYLIEILHQTTTCEFDDVIFDSCILSKFYIKPQPLVKVDDAGAWLYLIEILHQTTTLKRVFCTIVLLYLIEILHQTTTLAPGIFNLFALYLIEILHQTTTRLLSTLLARSCILSKFYIKPQPPLWTSGTACVVSYRNSTSNHNYNRAAVKNGRGCILSKFYIKPQQLPH